MSANLPEFAISVRQPWAWAIIHGGKDVENRVKRAITLGRMDQHDRLAIHASSGMTRQEYEWSADFMQRELGLDCPLPDQLVRGAIIGWVDIRGVTKDCASPWFFGPWALQLENPCSVETPLPALGQLGAFRWSVKKSALRDALPWMEAWPDCRRSGGVKVAKALPLFDGVAK